MHCRNELFRKVKFTQTGNMGVSLFDIHPRILKACYKVLGLHHLGDMRLNYKGHIECYVNFKLTRFQSNVKKHIKAVIKGMYKW